MKSKEEKLALLEETAKAFTLETRSVKPESIVCLYGGRGCAVGRLIADKQLCARLDAFGNSDIKNPAIWELIPEDVKEWGVDLLSNLQMLHDLEENWDSSGLTERGRQELAEIKEFIIKTSEVGK